MINRKDIEEEILALEDSKVTLSTLEKLAVLYTVRNNISSEYSFATESNENDSEFISALKGANYELGLKVLDEHMDCIKILYPKEYKKILFKLGHSNF